MLRRPDNDPGIQPVSRLPDNQKSLQGVTVTSPHHLPLNQGSGLGSTSRDSESEGQKNDAPATGAIKVGVLDKPKTSNGRRYGPDEIVEGQVKQTARGSEGDRYENKI